MYQMIVFYNERLNIRKNTMGPAPDCRTALLECNQTALRLEVSWFLMKVCQ